MFNPKEFLLETITRIVSSSPKYFNIIKWVAAIGVCLPSVSEWVLEFLNISEPSWLVWLNDRAVKAAGIAGFFIAHLTKKDVNDLPK